MRVEFYAAYFGETIFFTSPTDGNDNRLEYIYISNATLINSTR